MVEQSLEREAPIPHGRPCGANDGDGHLVGWAGARFALPNEAETISQMVVRPVVARREPGRRVEAALSIAIIAYGLERIHEDGIRASHDSSLRCHGEELKQELRPYAVEAARFYRFCRDLFDHPETESTWDRWRSFCETRERDVAERHEIKPTELAGPGIF